MATHKKLGVDNLYVTPTGIKNGAKGLVQHPNEVLSSLSKGERRKIRKALDANGRNDLSRASLRPFRQAA